MRAAGADLLGPVVCLLSEQLTNFLQVLYGALRLASLPMPASKEK